MLREDRGALAEDRLSRGLECREERKQKRSHHENRNDDQRDVAQNEARTLDLTRSHIS